MKLTNGPSQSLRGLPASKAGRVTMALLLVLSLSHCAQFSGQNSGQGADQPSVSEQQPPEKSQAPAERQAEQSADDGQAAGTDSTPAPVLPKPLLQPAQQTQFQQATELMRNQDYQQALTLLQPLAQHLPQAAGIHYNLAMCYWQLQQPEQARQLLTALVEQQPDYLEASNLLGVMARQAGNFNQARRYWLDALERNNDFASAHKNLGFLYELYLAQPEQARYHYQQYQQLTADPMAEAWLSLLEQQE
ncbi:tetratricopeptide repeat protein [Arsukibacterium sp.]|uniref:tetratricopeptide repeat protein n=1 Tax=Arsukibacterium sp. TaxID=1977258 RepID=UPI001BD2B21B|nr:tetratricopeptide repeat protein [Arsukibacterium sp.]